MFTPRSIGAPAQFHDWHDAQLDALFRVSDSSERFIAITMPTGTGKSLLAWSIAAFTGQRTLILTATRFLSDQYRDDFGSLLADVRGQQNYVCRAAAPGQPLQRYGHGNHTMCDRGPCHHGVQCALMWNGCDYYDAVTAAAKFDGSVSSNYSYWLSHGKALMAGRRDDEVLGQFDVLVLDEAHEAVRELRKALRVELHRHDLRALVTQYQAPFQGKVSDWSTWAQRALPQVEELTTELRKEVSMIGLSSMTADMLRRLRSLREGLDMVSTIDDSWVITDSGQSTVFEAVHPRRYSERLLFRGIKKVVMMSATLTEKDVEELGASG